MAEIQSSTPLGEGQSIEFLREFHVELLRGGMNRLLIRSLPTETFPTRIEILFQRVFRLDIPMNFDGLTVSEASINPKISEPWSSLATAQHSIRIYELQTQNRHVGRIAAADCAYGEDDLPNGSPSMFFMMD